MGGGEMPPASVFGPRKRSFNLISLGTCIFVPWFLFAFLLNMLSFKLHYYASSIVWGIVLCSSVLVIVPVYLGIAARRSGRDSLWYFYFATSCLIAICAASVLGQQNFAYNMKPFIQIQTMNMYPDVDPAVSKGEQLMDAGRMYFKKGTGIDMTRAMGFRNFDLFCVAPIVIGNEPMASYDFWAIGTNCCSGVSSDFRCGDYNKPNARAGLRLMRDEDRAFYRLAVQQAEAAYNLKATHPLFFHWIEDPIDEINAWEEAGYKEFLIGVFASFAFFLCAMACTVMGAASGSIGGEPRPY